MRKEELLNKILKIYQDNFDMKVPFAMEGSKYDAYAFCKVTNAKYVLVKRAELWRAICYEHVFFRLFEDILPEDIDSFLNQVSGQIEPNLVRGGKACMEKDHMFSYITGIFVCENGISREVKKKIRRAYYYRNYRFSIRGYCQLRLLAVDMENNKILGNGASGDLIKDYKKFII